MPDAGFFRFSVPKKRGPEAALFSHKAGPSLGAEAGNRGKKENLLRPFGGAPTFLFAHQKGPADGRALLA